MPPIVMIHGATLSGKSYETTPDGRMGWYEYFTRRGFPSYVVDQVGRAKSGFDQAAFNRARAGSVAPASQPALRRMAGDVAWTRFRFGPAPGVRFDDTRFPVDSSAQFAKQAVPDLMPSPTSDEANYAALSELATGLGRSILLGHSQSGRFPFEVALRDPKHAAALVAVEPGGCNANIYTAAQIDVLAKLPILIVFGDHLEMKQSTGPDWLPFLKDCEAFAARLKAVGGNVRILHTPELGIRGNSHMIMQDDNNLGIADLIIDWIRKLPPPR